MLELPETGNYVNIGNLFREHLDNVLGHLLQIEQHQGIECIAKVVITLRPTHDCSTAGISGSGSDGHLIPLDIADDLIDQVDILHSVDQRVVQREIDPFQPRDRMDMAASLRSCAFSGDNGRSAFWKPARIRPKW